MLKIDAHQHFWRFDSKRDSWITDDMISIRKDFLPKDLIEVLSNYKIEACVAVQSCLSEQDNEFLLELANNHPFIKGVVGWIDLQADNLEERLHYYQKQGKLKGFRHNLQAEPDIEFMFNARFKRGISLLNQYGFTYDFIIKPNQIWLANQFVKCFPMQRFVIDHMAKPFIKGKEINLWKKDIRVMAQNEQVYCKVSGFSTEADWEHWELKDINPYLDTVFEAFGVNRVMFGSDWPVCILAGGYDRMMEAIEKYTSELSIVDQSLFWGGNARSFYHLDDLIN